MQRPNIKDVLREKILILDGAMGSLIQQYNLTDTDISRAEQNNPSIVGQRF